MSNDKALKLIDALYSGKCTIQEFLHHYCLMMGKDIELSRDFILACNITGCLSDFAEIAIYNLLYDNDIIVITSKDGKYKSSYINKQNKDERIYKV